MSNEEVKRAAHGVLGIFVDPLLCTPGYDTPLIRHIRDMGGRVDFAACRHLRAGEAESPDFEFFRLVNRFRSWLVKHDWTRRLLRLVEYPPDLLRLRRHVCRKQYDVIHYDWRIMPWLDLAFMRKLRRIGFPVVLTVHDAKPHEARRVPLSSVLAWKEADRLIALTETIKKAIVREGIEAEKISVIPHGDLAGYFPDRASDDDNPLPQQFRRCPLVVFLGIISAYKGVPDLLRAWPLVVKQIPEAKLAVAGKLLPNCRREVETAVGELGRLRDTVQTEFAFLSPERYTAYLARAAVLVQPYQRGSQSGNTVEAYRFGVPVVCTRVGGLPEMVEDGRTGAVAEPMDPQSLASAIAETIKANAQGEMSDRCKELARTKYSWDRIAGTTLEVYQQVAAKGPKGVRPDSRPAG